MEPQTQHFRSLSTPELAFAVSLDVGLASRLSAELLERLSALYTPAAVVEVAKELAEAREMGYLSQVEDIQGRDTRRMHDLSRFMEGLLQRFTRWFNRAHSRSGNLWEDAFKSVIVEDGVAARTICAYINLNPVRAGMVTDPADYRWSSYGEAMGSRAFVNEAFENARQRFGLKRKDGARKLRGVGAPAAGILWSFRDF